MRRPKLKEVCKAYSDVLDTPAGKIVLRDLMDAAGVWRGGFTSDSNVLYFREGERNVGLRILSRLAKHSPERLQALLGMTHETNSEREAENHGGQPGNPNADHGDADSDPTD